MQTAAQVPHQDNGIPQVPQIPQMSPNPVTKKSTNSLVKASFIIGLILLGLTLVNSLFINYLPIILINRLGWTNSRYSLFLIAYQSILFIIPGIVGFILGIVGFRKMVKNPPPYSYFMAISGITLCFTAALGLMHVIAAIVSSLMAPLFF